MGGGSGGALGFRAKSLVSLDESVGRHGVSLQKRHFEMDEARDALKEWARRARLEAGPWRTIDERQDGRSEVVNEGARGGPN